MPFMICRKGKRMANGGWGREGVNKLESSHSPLLASPQGGVAERSKKMPRSIRIARPGWFSDKNNKENHPGCVASVASRYLLDDTATPPCGDARRGLLLSSN